MTRLIFPSFALLAFAAAAQAQEAPTAPVSPEACTGIESDAQRLACYDAAMGRATRDAATADAVAAYAGLVARDARQQAAAQTAAGPEERRDQRARRRLSELFGHDDDAYRDAIANVGKGSLLDGRWELAKDSKLGTFNLRAYKPVYLLPAFWTSDVNETPSSPNPDNTVTTPQDLDNTELKFQLSFKTKVAENLFGDNGDVWVGYTQSSRWQAYNSEASRPFRETNYEPEAMLVLRTGYSLGGWKGRLLGVSLNHQSNGRSDPLSRSWNRVIFNIGLDHGDWALMLRPWLRIKEDRNDDNNPDIADYVGRGDATLVWNRNGHELSLMGRHSLRGGDDAHGAVQVDWGFPIDRGLRGHLQLFHGYGESMIDYNHKATYIGLGISLLEWF
ncbi:MAG: phospholipase A [Pseudoxanthomonas sp.]